MAEGKWIEGLTGDMPFAAAAKHVLAVRLDAVHERLALAVFHSSDDLEHVHQLRVGTRRAGAAVRIFGECLSNKERKTLSKMLKSIRRAAGAARDWDVFQEAVSQRSIRATAPQKPGFDFLLGYGQGQRAVAQKQLDGLVALAQGEYQLRTKECLESLDDLSEGGTFRSQAIPRLTTLLQELDAAALQDLQDYEKLHQVRIVGKQLRYAMEIFAECFAPDFRESIYPEIEEMQEILGLANDSHVAVQRLTEIRDRLEKTLPKEWRRCEPAIEALMRAHQKRLPEQRRHFLKWWKAWRTAGTEGQLHEMLE